MNRFFCLLLIISISLFSSPLLAQTADKENPLWMERWRELLEQGTDEEEASTLFDELSALQDHPININQVTEEDLRRIPFLSEEQIEAVLFYQYTHNPIQTLYELKLVEGLDLETIQLISPFFYVGEPLKPEEKPFWERYFKVYRSKLSFRSEYNFNKKRGYIGSDDQIPPYAGSPFGGQIRYMLGNSKHFQAGISLRKSPGEELDGGLTNPSLHILVQRIGIMKRMVIGDYRIRFGQGLVINNCFSLGKTSLLQAQNNSSQGIFRSSSANPELALRGIAFTTEKGASQITAFASLKKIDARIENGEIVTIYRTGKYRTDSEISARNQAQMGSLGVHYGYQRAGFHVGGTVLMNQFNRDYRPTPAYYNEYQTFGKRSLYGGADYRYRTAHWDVSGESAVQQNGSSAFSHLFQIRPADDWSLRLYHRYFSTGYTNHWANALSESSSVNCEQGWLIGFQGALSAKINIEGYADFFTFDRPKSGIAAPSKGWDNVVKLSYNPASDYLFVITYRYKEKDKNQLENLSGLLYPLPTYGHRLKCEAHYGNKTPLLFHSFLEYSHYRMQEQSPQKGTLLAQQIEWSPPILPIRIFASITLFDTQDTNTSFYARDRSALYSFLAPNVSGQGARISANIRYLPQPNASVSLQYGRTEYTDRTEIGSGNERIDSTHKDDLFLTCSYTFK